MITRSSQEYEERTESVPPFQMHIASYRFGNVYYCSVDNVDPGAVIARSEGTTRKDAEMKAVEHARERLKRTRVQ
ncbi:MAG: hypothetical protein WAV76_07705 [Bacteroidota bacterium]